MNHIMFIQKTKKDKREEYIQSHKRVWPELIEAHRDAGIKRELIWMKGDYIYLYIMAEDFEKAMENLTKTKIFKEWIKKMTPLLDEIQDYSGEGKVIRLDKVFDLEEQLEECEK